MKALPEELPIVSCHRSNLQMDAHGVKFHKTKVDNLPFCMVVCLLKSYHTRDFWDFRVPIVWDKFFSRQLHFCCRIIWPTSKTELVNSELNSTCFFARKKRVFQQVSPFLLSGFVSCGRQKNKASFS